MASGATVFPLPGGYRVSRFFHSPRHRVMSGPASPASGTLRWTALSVPVPVIVSVAEIAISRMTGLRAVP